MMAAAFRKRLKHANLSDMAFEGRFGLLTDAEWAARKNNRLSRLIKNAGFACPKLPRVIALVFQGERGVMLLEHKKSNTHRHHSPRKSHKPLRSLLSVALSWLRVKAA
ncbi:hypothetical protein [Desulfitobacterium sp. AusDCA]|uniref:hypothetical protein n=1 Tax=Desulfitobacterium sp. AusDCA TaxID=3240383 RepID=UPI003DA77BEA